MKRYRKCYCEPVNLKEDLGIIICENSLFNPDETDYTNNKQWGNKKWQLELYHEDYKAWRKLDPKTDEEYRQEAIDEDMQHQAFSSALYNTAVYEDIPNRVKQIFNK